MSEAQDILTGLHERLQTLDGLSPILDYEPASVEPPMIYSLLDEVGRPMTGALVARRYRFLHRLVVLWIDNREAEQQLLSYANQIAAAIDADPYLGGRITSGGARIVDQQAGFTRINNVLYRILDSYSEVVVKGRYQDGH